MKYSIKLPLPINNGSLETSSSEICLCVTRTLILNLHFWCDPSSIRCKHYNVVVCNFHSYSFPAPLQSKFSSELQIPLSNKFYLGVCCICINKNGNSSMWRKVLRKSSLLRQRIGRRRRRALSVNFLVAERCNVISHAVVSQPG